MALLEVCNLGPPNFDDWMTPWLRGLIFDGFHRLDDSMALRLDFLWIPSISDDCKWLCLDFMDLGVFWGKRVFQPVRRDYTGLDGSRGPKETLQSWNLHSDE